MADKKELPMAEKKQIDCGCGCTASPRKGEKNLKPAAEEHKN